MGDLLDDITDNGVVQNLLSSLIWVAALAAVVAISARRRHRRWWYLRQSKGSVIRLVPGTLDPLTTARGYTYSTTTTFDAAATAYCALGVATAYRDRFRIRTHDSEHFNRAFWDDVVVLVGGRVRNRMTRELLLDLEGAWEFPYAVVDGSPDEPRRIVRRSDAQEFAATIGPTGSVEKDYALLCRLPNPYAPSADQPVFVLYGLHAYGVLGAAKILTPEYVGQLMRLRSPRSEKWSQILVEVNVRDEDTYPTILQRLPLDPRPAAG